MSPVEGGGVHHAQRPMVVAWICPACRGDQVGDPQQGCPSCGSGKPGYRVAPVPQPPPPAPPSALRIHDADSAYARGVRILEEQTRLKNVPGDEPVPAGYVVIGASPPHTHTPDGYIVGLDAATSESSFGVTIVTRGDQIEVVLRDDDGVQGNASAESVGVAFVIAYDKMLAARAAGIMDGLAELVRDHAPLLIAALTSHIDIYEAGAEAGRAGVPQAYALLDRLKSLSGKIG